MGRRLLHTHLQAVESGQRVGGSPVRFSLDYDIASHPDESIMKYVARLELPRVGPLHIIFNQRLVVDGHETMVSRGNPNSRASVTCVASGT